MLDPSRPPAFDCGEPIPFRRVGDPVLISAASIEPEPIDWLWPGMIPVGMLSMMFGDPGMGKGCISMDIASRVTTGAPFPDSTEGREPGGVLILSGEDDPASAIVPRLMAAGAERSRVQILKAVVAADRETGEEVEDPGIDLRLNRPTIERALECMGGGCRLMLIDPISCYLGAADSHKDADIRRVLSPLNDIARRFGVAMLVVGHTNKSGAGKSQDRLSGSRAFSAAARAVYQTVQVEGRHYLSPSKCNVCEGLHGFGYRIVGASVPTRRGPCRVAMVEWGERDDRTADEVLASVGDGESEVDRACRWLRDVLAYEAVASADLAELARDEGLSRSTYERARKAAGVQSFRQGQAWYSRLTANTFTRSSSMLEEEDLDTGNRGH